MNRRSIKKKSLSVLSVLALALTMLAGFPAAKAYAASGNVYTCTINRCYAHPVTGVIEDSGGEASYATGQGMVEGCVYSGGILEVTDDGAYYLTIRMSLMDYTSGHSFLVQNVGDSDWTAPSEIGVTANGTDSNGTTADVCMRVPSENCIVRGTMYVEPMGRNVVFYVYPSDYSEGNNTDMNATIVTSASGTDNSGNDGDGNNGNNTYTGTSGDASADNTVSGSQSGSSSLQSSTGSQTSGNSSLQNSTGNDKNSSGDSDKAAESESETGSAPKLQSSIAQAAAPSASSGTGTDSSTLNSAEGLSLSTAQDVSDEENTSTDAARTSGSSAFQIGLAITIAGLILIAVAAGVVYFFRRNWRRWGGGEDDEEE